MVDTSRKAVILAGGLGTRLLPLTDHVNKHLLPVGSKPMLFWAIEYLISQCINNILIVVGHKGCGEIMQTVKSKTRWGINVYFAYQDGEGGIAEALKLAQPFFDGAGPVTVMLGDNIFTKENKLSTHFRWLQHYAPRGTGLVYTVPSDSPELFGVAELHPKEVWNPAIYSNTTEFFGLEKQTTPTFPYVKRVVEKPVKFISNLVTAGLYVYPADVFDLLRTLGVSARNELEISDLNNLLARRGSLVGIPVAGHWMDAGTPNLYRQANEWAFQHEQSQLCA